MFQLEKGGSRIPNRIEVFDACPEFLRNWARFALETGMRRKELRSLKWADVHVDPVGKARRGYIHVRGTKSQNSKRNLSLTAAAQIVLLRQRQISQCESLEASINLRREPLS